MCDVGVENKGERQEKVGGCEPNREGNRGSESYCEGIA